MTQITRDEVLAAVVYCATTGQFTWPNGKKAGSVSDLGYLRIGISGRRYRAHRLAWLIVHGVWPQGEIDHLNGDRLDNRICNLRDVDGVVNRQNKRRANSNNTVGVLGVRKSRTGKRFRAAIKADGKTLCLGAFATADEAHAAYVKAKRELHGGCTL